MSRWYYSNTIKGFLQDSSTTIVGQLSKNNEFSLETTQRDAWLEQIHILRNTLKTYQGTVYFEYTIPRMGRRVDVVVLIDAVVFVLEFKVGAKSFLNCDIDQVWDYALDLKNFHEASHGHHVAPILIATEAASSDITIGMSCKSDKAFDPVCCNGESLDVAISTALEFSDDGQIDSTTWASSRYCPTPTIIEAATALYNNHSVESISRSDAGAINLSRTSNTVAAIIKNAKANSRKTICFVTGVPGAGKTLVGLNIATTHYEISSDLYSVFLSGNGPLVNILREALVRDKVFREKKQGQKITKKEASSEVQMFIQNVHNFRDDCLFDMNKPPIEHVAIFDEAQRAWNKKQTADFMKRKKNRPNFSQSEPEFLISCLDRHPDWAVIVCLVGGGQEINTGEAGIGEWLHVLEKSFPEWNICLSSQITDNEYAAGQALEMLRGRTNVTYKDDLHLSVSMRSFRAENVSLLVKQILDKDVEQAAKTLKELDKYPIAITRELKTAKKWLKNHARGSERYGIVASSQAERLKPHAIDVKTPINPVNWFLNSKEDVRSSYYLEDVATEFHIQGLELDWTCVTWDADFRHATNGWIYRSFRGSKWTGIHKDDRKMYLKNAYRVLLTRARQGMVIVVPPGDNEDPTRLPEYYDPTFEYLQSIGFEVL
ncbi:MAG: DUF2075 domain-containing protein [Pirellulales bacterium]|nr:DUF2075 domain-containing protein [Pirellulales bacterium]